MSVQLTRRKLSGLPGAIASRIVSCRYHHSGFDGRSVLWFVLVSAILLTLPATAMTQTPEAPSTAPMAKAPLTGKALYDFNCGSCHGEDLRGHGPVAQVLKTAPTNLTTLAKTHGGNFPREQVRDYIVGSKTLAAHGTRRMPVWGPSLKYYYYPYGLYVAQLSDAERGRRIAMIIDYIASKQVK